MVGGAKFGVFVGFGDWYDLGQFPVFGNCVCVECSVVYLCKKLDG